MKATGMVRRVDELGRVVIPKEIRQTLRLKSGAPLEIYTDRDELILKKYSPVASIERFAEGTAKSLNSLSGLLALVADTDGVLVAAGNGRKEFAGKRISGGLDRLMQERKSYVANLAEGGDVVPVCEEEEGLVTAQTVVPVVSGGDCLGAVVLLSTEQGARIDANSCRLAQLAASILANQFE